MVRDLFIALVLLLLTQIFGRSHYDILGISKTSSSKVISKTYRQLAKKLHPDKNKTDPKAKEKFIEISKAYEIIGDEKKRKEYDNQLKYGLLDGDNNEQRNNGNGGSGSVDSNFYNFNNEEVYVFQTADGRVFTRPVRQQRKQKHYRTNKPNENNWQNHQSAYDYESENTFYEPPETIFEYIFMYVLKITMSIGTLLFFILMFTIALYQIYPEIFHILLVVLIFLLIFYPKIFSCCCSSSNSKMNKNNRNSKNNSKKDMTIPLQKNNENETLQIITSKNLIKGIIYIIVYNDSENNMKNLISIKSKYKRDPLSFYCGKKILVKNPMNSNDTDNKNNDINNDGSNDGNQSINNENENKAINNEINNDDDDGSCDNDNTKYYTDVDNNNNDSNNNIKTTSNYPKEYDFIAIYKSGQRWVGLSLVAEQKIRNTYSDSTSNNNNSSNSNNKNILDIWLLKLLSGEIKWIVTEEVDIPIDFKHD